jgi:hypothetical protein
MLDAFETGSPPPLLLIAWRRPHTTKQVIDAIRVASPARMFIACDGPNPDRPGEVEKVSATRALIEREIDWPCQIEHLYSDTNQGCRLGVSRAISWFFQQVEEGIILEDDCVPHPDFFPYCAELLERYRHDERVWCVSGNNFQDGRWRGDGSYYFSHYTHIWGWASWRRCWRQYDSELSLWPDLKASGLLESVFDDPIEREYWSGIWNNLVLTGQPDTWDYQWLFTCWVQGGLTLLPNTNLVSNVGFGAEGTNCTDEREPTAFGEAALVPVRHPSFIMRDREADRYTFDHHFGGSGMREQMRLRARLRSRLKARFRYILNQWQAA